MDRLKVITAESDRFAEALAAADPERVCPTCPAWNAADLLWHLIDVHYFWSGVLSLRVEDEDGLPAVEAAMPARPTSMTELMSLREEATSSLVEQLANRDDDEACWSWFAPDQTVGFTRRMQTYEATMHRVDAELAAGSPVGPIAPDVAGGAVGHAIDVMWTWMPQQATYSTDAVVEFVATDTDARWLADVGTWTAPDRTAGTQGRRAVRSEAGRPTASVVGRAEDLALWCWSRGGEVRTSGDPASLDALNAVVAQGMG